MRTQAFALLSLHAKMHSQLDQLDMRRRSIVARIEKAEIQAYDNDAEYQQLEAMKKELLSIRFV